MIAELGAVTSDCSMKVVDRLQNVAVICEVLHFTYLDIVGSNSQCSQAERSDVCFAVTIDHIPGRSVALEVAGSS
jgi:hypothetical protein